MQCSDKTIKDLLPLHLEGALDEQGRKRVDEHLASCDDCRSEHALLQMMAEEPVPDPGEAFWASMPGRIQRTLRQEKRPFSLGDLLSGVFVPRRAWAPAAVALLIIALWFLLRPPSVDIAITEMPEDIAALDDVTGEEPVSVAQLSSKELDAAVQWARNELEPIRESIGEGLENTQQDLSDDLSDMSTAELGRLYEMLNKKDRT